MLTIADDTSFHVAGNGRSLHRALGILDHGEMSLDHWEGFGRPSFHVTIIPALCLFLELSNVIFVVRLKQFQILPVEVRGSDVLGPNTPGVELDAFSVGRSVSSLFALVWSATMRAPILFTSALF